MSCKGEEMRMDIAMMLLDQLMVVQTLMRSDKPTLGRGGHDTAAQTWGLLTLFQELS